MGEPFILAVDADESSAVALRAALSSLGHAGTVDVRREPDLEEALRQAAASPPLVVVLCIDADAAYSFTPVRRIRKGPLGSLPLVVTSASADQATLDKHGRLPTHADAYLTKPLDPDRLMAELLRWVHEDTLGDSGRATDELEVELVEEVEIVDVDELIELDEDQVTQEEAATTAAQTTTGDLHGQLRELEARVGTGGSKAVEMELANLREQVTHQSEDLVRARQRNEQFRRQHDQTVRALEEELRTTKKIYEVVRQQLRRTEAETERLKEKLGAQRMEYEDGLATKDVEVSVANEMYETEVRKITEQRDRIRREAVKLQEALKRGRAELERRVEETQRSETAHAHALTDAKQAKQALETAHETQLAEIRQRHEVTRDQLETDLDVALARVETLAGELESAQAKQAETEAQLGEKEAEAGRATEQFQERITALEGELAAKDTELNEARESAAGALEEAQGKVAELEEQLEAQEQEGNAAWEAAGALETQLGEARKGLEERQEQLDSLQQEHDAAQAALAEQVSAAAELDKNLSELRDAHVEAQRAVVSYEEKESGWSEREATLEQELGAAREQTEKVTREKDEWIATLEGEMEELRTRTEELTATRDEVQATLEAEKAAKAEVEEALETERASASELQQGLEEEKAAKAEVEEALGTERARASELQQGLEEEMAARQDMEQAFEAEQASKAELEQRIEDQNAALEAAEAVLTEEKEAHEAAVAERDDLRAELSTVVQERDELEKTASADAGKLVEMEQTIADLGDQIRLDEATREREQATARETLATTERDRAALSALCRRYADQLSSIRSAVILLRGHVDDGLTNLAATGIESFSAEDTPAESAPGTPLSDTGEWDYDEPQPPDDGAFAVGPDPDPTVEESSSLYDGEGEVVEDPESLPDEPELFFDEPDPFPDEPEPFPEEPDPADDEPEPTDDEPEIADDEPEIADDEPEASDEPELFDDGPEPEELPPEPEDVEPEIEFMEPEPLEGELELTDDDEAPPQVS